ncbi:MAG: MATE family efflux transporter [Chloroflexota bacterium]|nr:MATE family efflux transporter [Chloroflexota bacterium]
MSKATVEGTRASITPAAGARPAPAVAEVDSPRAIRALVIRLAWPSILENMLQSIFGIVTMIMVARLGPAAIAGVGASNQIIMVAMAAFFALSMGTTVLVAHATGARNREAARLAAKQSLVLGLGLGGLVSLLGATFAPALLRAIGAAPEVVREGAPFLRIFALGSVFLVTGFIAGGALRGAGDTRTPMLVTLGTLVASLSLAYPLIFGRFGLPALGVAGAALAAGLARAAGCVVLLGLLLSPRRAVSITGRGGWRPAPAPLARLVNIGLPSMFESLFRAGGMLAFSVIVFRLGTTVAAAQQIAQQAAFFSMMPGFGFAMAATTVVGQSLGAGKPERAWRGSLFAVRSCLAWMGGMGIVFLVGGPLIMRLFTNDREIIGLGAVALGVIALAQPGQAIGMTLAGSLRGAGDTRYPMLTTGLTMWLVRLPLAYLFGITLGLGLAGIYLGWVVDSIVLAAANFARYRTGRWKERRVAVG